MTPKNDSPNGEFEEMFSVEEQDWLREAVSECEKNMWIFNKSKSAADIAKQAKIIGLRVETQGFFHLGYKIYISLGRILFLESGFYRTFVGMGFNEDGSITYGDNKWKRMLPVLENEYRAKGFKVTTGVDVEADKELKGGDPQGPTMRKYYRPYIVFEIS